MADYSDHPVFATSANAAPQLGSDELGRIRRLLERLPTGEPLPIEQSYGDADLARLAKGILKSRRDIEGKFGDEVANDPSIDLLLALFIRRAHGEMMTVSEACAATSAPCTTALRRLTLLTERGFVERVRHRHDKRTVFVKLSDGAMATMRRWLESTRAAI